MLLWLYMVPVNTGESKKLINVNIDGNIDGKNSVVTKRKQSYFLIYKKAYYQDLTIIMKDYTFDIPSISIISLSNKE